MNRRNRSLVAIIIFLVMLIMIQAQENVAFRDVKAYKTFGTEFTDAVVEELLTTLDDLLKLAKADANFQRNLRIHFWRFFNRLDQGLTTKRQDERIGAYLEGLKTKFPDSPELIERQLYHYQNLMIGRSAPNIIGRDLHGEEFQLNDYRGHIVVLYFTGHWCGPCRGEYPFQRLLLEIMANDPVVLLGVNSDTDRKETIEVKQKEKLNYRSWWAGWDADEDPRSGPIPRKWTS